MTLTDIRDNNTYAVAKLKDNKCWMTQNLRIQNITLKSTDSDVQSDFILPASNYSSFDRNNETVSVYVDSDNQYGGYYSWKAAMAGSVQESPQSICPRGWALPDKSVFQALFDKYDKDSIKLAPANFALAGDLPYDDGTAHNRDSSGYYWTSTGTTSDATYFRIMEYNSNSENGYWGNSVRCISVATEQKRSYKITYNANGGSSTPNPQTGVTYGDSVILDASTSRGGYEFLGWCTVNPGSSTSCSGQLYEDGSSIPLTSENNNITLYATWKIYPSASSFSCSSLSVDQSVNLNWTNTTASVTKLKDGRCWINFYYNYENINGAYNGCVNKCSAGGFRLPSQSDFQTLYNAYPSSYIPSFVSWYNWTSTRGSNSQYQVIADLSQKTFNTNSTNSLDSNQASNTTTTWNYCGCVKN